MGWGQGALTSLSSLCVSDLLFFHPPLLRGLAGVADMGWVRLPLDHVPAVEMIGTALVPWHFREQLSQKDLQAAAGAAAEILAFRTSDMTLFGNKIVIDAINSSEVILE